MKKKVVMIGAGAVVGSMLLMSSVYAGIGNAPGYEAYKSAINTTAAVQNVTERGNVSITDNGQVLLQVNATAKSDKEANTGSVNITMTSGTTEQTMQIFRQEDKTILKTDHSDAYQIVELGQEEREMFEKHANSMKKVDPAMMQDMENVMDALVGDLKNYVTLDETGEDKEIAMHLTSTQIPAIVNTIGSMFIKASGRDNGEEMKFNPAASFGLNVNEIKDSLPKLTDDIRIDAVNLDAKVNADNQITNQAGVVEISGKDRSGAVHQVVVKFDLGMSEFNSTTPDTIDLTGKKVENLESFMQDALKNWHKK